MPTEVDFDALWENVYQPVLEKDLGYKAVRADRDVGALIISQMVQRLAVADLVVADITLANANVYYEIGVRHAAKAQGCVLSAGVGTSGACIRWATVAASLPWVAAPAASWAS